MPYFPDFSPYTYFPGDRHRVAVNVGWLAAAHPFPTAEPDPAFVEALVRCAVRPVRNAMGFHVCDLCPRERRQRAVVELHGQRVLLGNGEIVVGTPARAFRAPTLVAHYVSEHAYAPPTDFVAAVLERARRVVVLPEAEREAIRALDLDAQRSLALRTVEDVIASQRDERYARALDAIRRREPRWFDLMTDDDDEEDPVWELLGALGDVLDDAVFDGDETPERRRALASYWVADVLERSREVAAG